MENSKFFNNIYRGIVVNNKELERSTGRLQIFVPGVYPKESENSGLLPWAEPAMPLFGECNKYSGIWARPAIGSHVWVFFEGGDHMRPVFFATIPHSKWLLSSMPGKYALATKSVVFTIDESALQDQEDSDSDEDSDSPPQITAGDIKIPGCQITTSAVADGRTNVSVTINGTLFITATGGIFCNLMPAISDKNKKENFIEIDDSEILDKTSKLDVLKWNYKEEIDPSKTTHIGPIAQDFYEKFELGNDTTINQIDVNGVVLASIKELKTENDFLKKELEQLKVLISDIQHK